MIFANIMKDKQKEKGYWSRLIQKYRFVIQSDNSFEEKFTLTLSFLTVFLFTGLFIFICFLFNLLLINYTPLNKYVAGKSSSEVQKQLSTLSLKCDSLEDVMLNREVYLKNINNIINGNKPTPPKEGAPFVIQKESELPFKKSKADSLLRQSVEAEDNSSIYTNDVVENNYLVFFTPISGLITDVYNTKIKHFGVDIVAKEKSRISSVLDGSVIISHWTIETGYVIMVQHKNDYISIYKHNSLLLKEVGDFVSAGEHIAIIGNSGELSSGPHLHFELWHKGAPVNPENYISF